MAGIAFSANSADRVSPVVFGTFAQLDLHAVAVPRHSGRRSLTLVLLWPCGPTGAPARRTVPLRRFALTASKLPDAQAAL